LDIFQEILSALESEERVVVATIIATSGSTPASAFSKMLVSNGGRSWSGTVGGGCMEGDVVEAARELYQQSKAKVLTFHLNEDEMVQGLICGGSLDVLIEPITRDHLPLIAEMRSLRDEGDDGIIATVIDRDGKITAKRLLRVGHALNEAANVLKSMLHLSGSELAEEAWKAHNRNETRRLKLADREVVLEPMVGRPHLVIFGGGHVSKSISRAASMTGFRVTVVDDRKEYANPERFPEAASTLVVEFRDAFGHLTIKPSTYIVIVTRGHRSDEVILEQAVKTPAKYIGMIGSRRKVLTTYEHLVERGIRAEDLERVQAPIGIELRAVTAEEIGISVVAQLIHVRRAGPVPIQHKSGNMKELFGGLASKERDRHS
jgi:xanthine dehydrogenase accessory factor